MTEQHPTAPAGASAETLRETPSSGAVGLLPRGPWCCEKGQALHMTVCPECEQTTRLYGSQYYELQPDGHLMLCNADGTRSIFDDVDE